jgi:predicted heme/steroid binding protein
MNEFGGLFGWLIIISFGGTILNYIIKFINRKWGKKISGSAGGKKTLGLLMKIFVRNHKIFGFATVLFLLLHFISQFTRFGINLTGALAACILLLQVFLGMYAVQAKKPRKGLWFILHRTIAFLLLLAISLHLLLPNILRLPSAASSSSVPAVTDTVSTADASSVSETTSAADTSASTEKVFTLDELATYNGQNGQPAYVAYKGIVYDVSSIPNWSGGKHNGETAGTDLTNEISKSPHGDKVFADLPVVGTLE